jgi:hypothetical protein
MAKLKSLTIAGQRFDLTAKADLVNGKVPAEQLPSYVDDVLEFANLAGFPETGETGKIYIAIDTQKIYRWGGSVFVEVPTTPEKYQRLSGTLPVLTGVESGTYEVFKDFYGNIYVNIIATKVTPAIQIPSQLTWVTLPEGYLNETNMFFSTPFAGKDASVTGDVGGNNIEFRINSLRQLQNSGTFQSYYGDYPNIRVRLIFALAG